MRALLLVDLQKDFLPGGALAVPEGDKIIPIINYLLGAMSFDLIIASKDWHPSDHGSFADNHQKQVGESILLGGINQILWPRHCVQGTEMAEFAPGWDTTKIDKVIYKGTERDIDSYSTFYDNGHLKETELESYLKTNGISELYVAGLATDYCVKFSVLDAIAMGFKTYVIMDACKGVNLQLSDSQKAFEVMQKAGAYLIRAEDLLSQVQL